ncbi:MAG TPA: hypothetical protein VJ801_15575 [Polyangia bacterium]|nr:hypothetical protein [Polyangia bacterium]
MISHLLDRTPPCLVFVLALLLSWGVATLLVVAVYTVGRHVGGAL